LLTVKWSRGEQVGGKDGHWATEPWRSVATEKYIQGTKMVFPMIM